MTLTIHHLNESRSQRVLWLAEELGLDYRLVQHRRDPASYRAGADLEALHPLGRAPLIERDGRVTAETGAIVAELARGSDLLPAEGSPDGDAVRYWLHYAEGSAMPPLVMRLVLTRSGEQGPRLMRPLARAVTGAIIRGYAGPEIARHVRWWERALQDGDGWFAAGRFTAADVMMSFPVEMAALRIPSAQTPAILDWLQRIHARPAYARAIGRGGDYSGAAAGTMLKK